MTYSVQCAAKKVSPKVVCHFLSSHLNFYVKFYTFITCSYAHKNAKWHLIAFNYCKVKEFFL